MDAFVQALLLLPIIACALVFWGVGMHAALRLNWWKDSDRAKWLRRFWIGIGGFVGSLVLAVAVKVLTDPVR